MKINFTSFDECNNLVTNKDNSINHYINYMLARTQSMFVYEGLPDTLPSDKLELMLQTNGYCFITEVENNLYCFTGSLGGELDVYNEPTKITVSNVALKLSKEYDIKTDGILINNDTMQMGLLPILKKYGALLAENMITINTLDKVLRMVCMISASDDRTQSGATKFISDIEKGKISAIGESAFFEGIKVHSVANTQNYIAQFIELEQYLKASCFNEIGLNANYNMKSSAVSSSESALNDDFLLPLVDNMIKERQIAIKKINEKYNLNIKIDYASAWKVTQEENEKQKAISESVINQVDENTDIEISSNEGHPVEKEPIISIKNGYSDTLIKGENAKVEDTEPVEEIEDNEPAAENEDTEPVEETEIQEGDENDN